MASPFTMQEEGPTGFTMQDDTATPALYQSAVDRRSADAHFAMGDASPGQDVLATKIATGDEPQMRQDFAEQRNTELRQTQADIIQDVAQREGPITPEQQLGIIHAAQFRPESPDVAWENAYARNFVKFAAFNDPDNSTMKKAFDDNETAWKRWPEAVRLLDLTSNNISRMKTVDGYIEELEARYKDSPIIAQTDQETGSKAGAWFSTLLDMAAGGLISNYRTYNVIKGARTGSILPGTNRGQQYTSAWLIGDPDEFNKTIRAAGEQLYQANPHLALEFIRGLRQFGTTDEFITNMWGVAGPASMIPIGATLRLGARLLGYGAKEAAGGAVKATEKATGSISEQLATQVAENDKTRVEASKRVLEPSTENYKQFDLFSGEESKAQGELFGFFTDLGKGKAPTETAKLPPGKLRATYLPFDVQARLAHERSILPSKNPETGLWEVSTTRLQQQELPLGSTPGTQLSLGLEGGGGKVQGAIRPGYSRQQLENIIEEGKGKGLDTSVYENELARRFKEPENLDKELGPVRNAMAETFQAGIDKRPSMQSVLEKTGNTVEAAKVGAVKILQAMVRQGQNPMDNAEAFFKQLPSFTNGSTFFANSTVLSQNLAVQAAKKALESSTELRAALADKTRVIRLSEDAEHRAVEEAFSKSWEEFNHYSNGIVDFVNNGFDPTSGTWSVGTIFGKPNKVAFTTKEEAAHWAMEKYKFQDGDWFVQHNGVAEHYIHVVRPIDETSSLTRMLDIATKDLPESTKTPLGFLNTTLSRYRTPEATMSKMQRDQRHVVVHGPQGLRSTVLDTAPDIVALKGETRTRLNTFLTEDSVRMAEKPDKWYSSAGEFEQAYFKRFGMNPSEQEVRAYHQFVMLNDFDYTLRAMGVHRDKSRLGVLNHRFELRDEKGNVSKTDWFEGVTRDDFNWKSPADAGIWVDTGVGKPEFIYKNDLRANPELKQSIKDILDNKGGQIIQLYEPMGMPLKEATQEGRIINYVVTSTAERKQLQIGQGLTYRPGGHIIYQHPWFGKVPVVVTGEKGLQHYYGDQVLFNARTELEGRQEVVKWEAARTLHNAGQEAALELHVNSNLGISLNEYKQLYHKGILHADNPVELTYTGKNVFESNPHLLEQERYQNLTNQIKHPDNIAQNQERSFLADRDPILSVMKQVGTESNPVFKLDQAPVIDALGSLQRGLDDVIRSRYLADYKISSAEQWVREFGHLLDRPIDQVNQNPLYALYHSKAKGGVQNNPSREVREMYKAMEVTRLNIQNLLGVQSDLMNNVTWVEQKLLNSLARVAQSDGKIVGKFSGAADRLIDFTYASPALLARIKDPAGALRAFAFHATLGLFNLPQLFVQGNGMAVALAVAGPQHAYQGFTGGFMFGMAKHFDDPAVINKIAGLAKSMGFGSKEEWLEAYKIMQSTGFHLVGDESAWKNAIAGPSLFQSSVGKFLDKGTIFFKMGEGINRNTAFMTAFKEFKAANPDKVIGQREVAEILTRADTLSGNMTRASKAAWESGTVGVATQFMTFNLRLMEQMAPFVGHLSTQEKLRAYVTYSLLYGVPVGLSAGTGFYPFYEDTRKAALDRGWNINDKAFKAVHEGLLSLAIEGAFGKEYNVAKRYGPGANSILFDSIKGEKNFANSPILGTILGPSGAVMSSIAQAAAPFVHYAGAALSGDPSSFKLHVEDFINLPRPISTANNLVKTIYGLNTGRYFSKQEGYVANIDKLDSFFLSTLGLTPQKIDDVWRMKEINKDWKEYQNKGIVEVAKEMRRGIEAGYRGESQKMHEHFTNAATMSVGYGYRPDQQHQILKQSLEGYESLADKMNQEWLKYAPAHLKDQRMKQFLRENNK